MTCMTTMKNALIFSALLVGAVPLALAKLAPLDDAAKAKAAETAARAAWQGKVDAFQLCKVQDRVAATYRKTAGKDAKAAPAAAKPAAGATAAVPATPAPAAVGCADPGVFAYNPPAQTPLETAGAHSPAGNAASPPSVGAQAAQMTPGAAGVPAPAKKP